MFTTHTLLGQKRYLGREKALVIDTRDPGLSGRIRINSRTLGESNWIPYIMSPGFFTPPKVGDWVYVECEDGLEWAPFAHGKATNLLVDLNGIPNSIYREVPTVTAWTSNGPLQANGQVSSSFGPTGFLGHAILLDDGQQVYNQGPTQYGSPSAGIKILSFGGNKIILSDTIADQKIIIADSGNTSTATTVNSTTGNRIVIDSVDNTISIVNESQSTYIVVGESNITIISSGTCNITSNGKTTITASEVDINSTGKTVVNASEVDVTAPLVNVISTDQVTMTTPLLDVSGFITCSGIATGAGIPIPGEAVIEGNITSTGNITAGSGNIVDSIGSLAGFRAHYNMHTHAPNPPIPTYYPVPTDP